MLISTEEAVRVINIVQENFGKKYHTSGSKAGRTFADHFINVAFVSYQLAKILESKEVIDSRDVELTFYAGLLHDMNKIRDNTLRQSADVQSIKEVLKELEVNENSFLFEEDNLRKLQLCISLHQDSGLAGMELLFEKGMFDSKAKLISRMVKFADKFDNFQSADLQADEHLKKSCEAVLQEISQLSDGKFKHVHLFYVVIKEFRGFLTELIYECLDNYLVNHHNLKPIARFPNGVVYLTEELYGGPSFYDEVVQNVVNLVLNNREFVGGLEESALSFSSTGVRLTDCALEITFDRLLSRLVDVARSQAKKYDERAVFLQGIQRICDKVNEAIKENEVIPEREKGEDRQKLKELFRQLYGYDFEEKTSQAEEYPESSEQAGIKTSQKLQDVFSRLSSFVSNRTISDLKQEALETFGDIFKKYSKSVGGSLEKYLKSYLILNGYGGQNIDELINVFNNYGPYEQTCSICGVSGKQMIEIRKNETPSIHVQAFTNRMRGHLKEEPRRLVCEFCRLQFLATKAKGIDYSEDSVIFVLLPGRYYPSEFLQVIKETAEDLTKGKRSKTTADGIFPSTLFRKKMKRKRSLFGNIVYCQYAATKKELKKWSTVSTMSTLRALLLSSKLPVRVLVTTDVLLLQDDIEFNEQILVKDAPAWVKRILNRPEPWTEVAKYTEEVALSDCILDLVKQPEELNVAAVLAKKWDEFDSKEVVSKLFKAFGGDSMQEIRRMAELADLWAYRRTGGTRPSDHQYLKPFVDAMTATRKFNPKQGEDVGDLEALLIEHVSRSLDDEEQIFQAKEFIDNFMEFLKKIGNGDIMKGREILIRESNKYRNIFLGNIKLLAVERMSKSKAREV